MTKLEDYVLTGNLDGFKTKLFEGITERPACCVEIMKRAFGDDYSISPILSQVLSNMYEVAINNLVKEGKINASNKFGETQNLSSVFTTSYVRVKK